MLNPHPMFGGAHALRVLLCTALLSAAQPGLAQAQANGEPRFPSDVEMLSLPKENGLRCYPPTARDTANVHLVFETGDDPADSREMHLDFGPDATLRSVGDIQFGRTAEGTTVMYTAVVNWGERGGMGLFVPLPLRQRTPADLADAVAMQRVLTPAEIAKAKRLGEWLIKMRCDLSDRTLQ
jgi:hypothetical protein